MLLYRHGGSAEVGDIARGNRSPIDDFELSFFSKEGKGEVMAHGEFFVYEGISGGSAVNQCVGLDHLVFGGQGACNNEMLPIHRSFLYFHVLH